MEGQKVRTNIECEDD